MNTQSSNSLKTILFSWCHNKKKKKNRIRTDKKWNEWREIDLIIFLNESDINRTNLICGLHQFKTQLTINVQLKSLTDHHLFTNLVEFFAVKKKKIRFSPTIVCHHSVAKRLMKSKTFNLNRLCQAPFRFNIYYYL